MTRALVTGAGIRLGRAMALYLAGRGYDVAVHYATSEQPAQETVAPKCRRWVARRSPCRPTCWMRRRSQALLPRAAEALGGPITCLVNNASIFEYDNIQPRPGKAGTATWTATCARRSC